MLDPMCPRGNLVEIVLHHKVGASLARQGNCYCSDYQNWGVADAGVDDGFASGRVREIRIKLLEHRLFEEVEISQESWSGGSEPMSGLQPWLEMRVHKERICAKMYLYASGFETETQERLKVYSLWPRSLSSTNCHSRVEWRAAFVTPQWQTR